MLILLPQYMGGYITMDKTRDAVQRMAVFSAQLYYHLTKAMVESFGEEAAEKAIAKGIHEFGLERGRNIAEKVKSEGLELSNANLDRFYDMPIDEGWAPEREENEEAVTFGVTKSCVFADYWRSKDWARIGRLYCEVDLAIREGYNPKLNYVPQSNILDGDAECTAYTSYKE